MHITMRLLLGVALVAAVVLVTSAGRVRAAIVDAMTCALSSPCLEWENTSSGDAIEGVSIHGNAVHGQTKFKSAGKSSGRAGVFGEDLSTSGTLDAGVAGAATNGTGVVGTSTFNNGVEGVASGGASGVYGQANFQGGFGVAGRNISTIHSSSGAGVLADGGPADDGLHVFANGSSANGLYAYSQSGSSLIANQGSTDGAPELSLAVSNTVPGKAILVQSPSGSLFSVGNDGNASLSGALQTGSLNTGAMTASSLQASTITNSSLSSSAITINGTSNGAALYSVSPNGNAANLISDNTSNYPAVAIEGVEGGSSEENILSVFGPSATDMSVSTYGNVYARGLFYSSGSCRSGCFVGKKQLRAVNAYAVSEAEPTIEDTGEATLVDGVAHVSLDPQFANVIDSASRYVVLITPEGDCRGLFVADRRQHGFVVREIQGGRSTVGFAYRIVAKRLGVNAKRLPMIDIRPVAMPPRPRGARHVGNGGL